MKRLLCVGAGATAALFLVAATLFVLSIPSYDKEVHVQGILAPVRVTFDAAFIPDIHASCREDAACALGYLHGKERFFQMDMMRRAASGELSVLFGRTTLQVDCQRRWHRFRSKACKRFSQLPKEQQSLLSAYARGVNKALETLLLRPWEYLLLWACPQPWTPEDSLLIIYNLYFELQEGEGVFSHTINTLQTLLPPQQQHGWLFPSSQWETYIDNDNRESSRLIQESSEPLKTCALDPSAASPSAPTLPGCRPSLSFSQHPSLRGSNGFAVAGSHTAWHGSLIAGELHLPMTMPSLWYRASLHYDDQGTIRHVHGYTLPGLPLTIVGTNEHLAWTVTNGQVNGCDIVYSNGGQALPVVSSAIERIAVRGGADVFLPVEETIYGPIRPQPFGDLRGIVHWVAHEEGSVNLDWMLLEQALSVEDAVRAAHAFRLPAMNLIVGDTRGHIGWCLCGALPSRKNPERRGYRYAESLDLVQIAGSGMPLVIDPPKGYLCSANQRPLPLIGDGWGGEAFLNPIRAYSISSWLDRRTLYTEQEALAGLLIDRSVFFDRWRDLLLHLLDDTHRDQRRLKEALEAWDGHCRPSSYGYLWIRLFREQVVDAVIRQKFATTLNLDLLDVEEPVWNAVTASSEPLSIRQEMLPLLHSVLQRLIKQGEQQWPHRSWSSIPWSEVNRCQSLHPLYHAFPFLGFLINGPEYSVGGDFYVPRVAWKENGATLRTVLSPGREATSIAQLPGGQSGHPLSSHYTDCFAGWMAAAPTPLLPSGQQNEFFLYAE